MPISVECPSCRAKFRVGDELAGKRGRCAACKASLTVPVPVPAASPGPQIDGAPATSPADEARLAEAAVATRVSAPENGVVAEADSSGSGGYERGGSPGKKAKVVRARAGALPGVGVGAEGVRQAAAPTRIMRTPAEILAAFRSEIRPFRPSPMYLLWLAVGAGVMVLLPLIYVALIGLVIWALGYHAVNNVAIFQEVHGGAAMKGAVLMYVVPLVCGGVIVAFMLKPLFARTARRTKGRTLDPQAEPLLHAFIDGVCTSVGAPRPERIEVDSEINAAAGFSAGPFSIFSREPVLYIGLGLAAGLNLKQFAGVMAHELGHISQGSGARLMEVISTINGWFARVVYERDEWDETLQSWAKSDTTYYILLVVWFSQLAVWLTRRVLWVLLRVGQLVNLVFIRQREYDADRYEARMVGADVFAQTTWRLRELSLASRFAMSDLQSSWQQRRLPDNYPKLILANVPQIPQETLDAYRKAGDEAKTGLFDTHPCDRDRIARAKHEAPGEGIFNLDGPATDVFRDFDALARSVTFDFYKSMLGDALGSDQLYPVAELVETQTAAQEGYVAAERFFLKALPMTQRLELPDAYPEAPTDPKRAKQALVKARDDQQAEREGCLAASERDSAGYVRLVKAEAARLLLKANLTLNAEEWGLPAATVRAAESVCDETEAELQGLEAELEPYAAAAARRLIQTLAILEFDTVADRVAEGRERREEAHALYACTAHLAGNVVSQLVPALRAKQVLELLVGQFNQGKNEKNQPLIDAILRAARGLHEQLQVLRRQVGDSIAYPFEHASEDITLGNFALPPALPEPNDVGGVLEVADAAIERLLGLYRRALGRLTVTAEEVERVLGLEPIAFEDAEPL